MVLLVYAPINDLFSGWEPKSSAGQAVNLGASLEPNPAIVWQPKLTRQHSPTRSSMISPLNALCHDRCAKNRCSTAGHPPIITAIDRLGETDLNGLANLIQAD